MRSTQRTQVLSAGCAIVALLLIAGPGRGEPLVGTNGLLLAVPEVSRGTTSRWHAVTGESVRATHALPQVSAEDQAIAEFHESITLYGNFMSIVQEAPVYVSRGLLILLSVAFLALLIWGGKRLRALFRRVTDRQKAMEMSEMERALPVMIAAYEKARISFARERAERVARHRDPEMVRCVPPADPHSARSSDKHVRFFQNRCRACGEWVALPILDEYSQGELLYQTADGQAFAHVTALTEPAWERVTAILCQNTPLPLLQERNIRLFQKIMIRCADPWRGQPYTTTFPLCPLCGSQLAHYDDRNALFDQQLPKVTWHHFLTLPPEEQVTTVLQIVDEEEAAAV